MKMKFIAFLGLIVIIFIFLYFVLLVIGEWKFFDAMTSSFVKQYCTDGNYLCNQFYEYRYFMNRTFTMLIIFMIFAFIISLLVLIMEAIFYHGGER